MVSVVTVVTAAAVYYRKSDIFFGKGTFDKMPFGNLIGNKENASHRAKQDNCSKGRPHKSAASLSSRVIHGMMANLLLPEQDMEDDEDGWSHTSSTTTVASLVDE